MIRILLSLVLTCSVALSSAKSLFQNPIEALASYANEDFEGSWQSNSNEKHSLRMKVRVDLDDIIAYLYNDKDEEFMVTGVIKEDVATVVIRDANHFHVCNATITLNNGQLDIKVKGSPDTKTTHIPKEFSFTKEY